MTVIELPDDEAAALTAKAAADGMPLKDWLGQLARTSEKATPLTMAAEGAEEPKRDHRPISEVIAEIMKDVTPEELAQLSKDGASQVDHYV